MAHDSKTSSISPVTKAAPKKSFQSIGDLFTQYQPTEDKGYISREFQDFGYRLAAELGDLRHKSLYIKLAKEVDRAVLEQARRFVIDADNAKSKARLFMWKVKQLKGDTSKNSPKSRTNSTQQLDEHQTKGPKLH